MFHVKTLTLVLLVALAGCGKDDTASVANTSGGPTVAIAGQSTELQDGYTSGGQQVAEGYGMAYSETALDETIPALPIFGFANGLPFNAGTVVFRQDHKGVWHLEVSDHAFDPVKGIADARFSKKDIQTIYITLPTEPASAAKIGRDMEYDGGFFQIKKSPDSMDTTSWNTAFAYKIEIDQWEMGPSQVASCGRPSLGKASGKLFVSFKGSNDSIQNSWISGQFKDAVILYCGK